MSNLEKLIQGNNLMQLANLTNKTSKKDLTKRISSGIKNKVKNVKNFKGFKNRKSISDIKGSFMDKFLFMFKVKYLLILFGFLMSLYFYKIIMNRNFISDDLDGFSNIEKKIKILLWSLLGFIITMIILNIVKNLIRHPLAVGIIIIIMCVLCSGALATVSGFMYESDKNKKNDQDIVNMCKNIVTK